VVWEEGRREAPPIPIMSGSMHLSNSEFFAAIIFLVSIVKTLWDVLLSNLIFKPRQKNTWVVFGTGKAPSA